jgi:hypothetical protein
LAEKWKNLRERGRLFLKQFIAGNLMIEKERFLEDLVEEFRRNVRKRKGRPRRSWTECVREEKENF